MQEANRPKSNYALLRKQAKARRRAVIRNDLIIPATRVYISG